MMFLQVTAIAVGLGFAIALIGSIKARAWNTVAGKTVFVDAVVPFAQRWALYSAAVGVAMLLSYGLAHLPR